MSKKNSSKDVQKSYDEDILSSKDKTSRDPEIKKLVQETVYEEMDAYYSGSKFLKILFLIILILSGVFVYLSIQKIEYVEQVQETINITREYNVTPKVTLLEYKDITDQNYIKDISVIGYIAEETVQGEGVQINNKYISDDNNIRLALALNDKANTMYERVVTDKTLTYRIEGNYRYTFDGFKLFVKNITREDIKTVKQIETSSENILVNKTREKNIINLTYGLEKISELKQLSVLK